MLTVWTLPKRSARFYGKYVGRKDQTYQKFQKKLSHQASPPFTGKWPTAVLQQRLFLTLSGAVHSIAQDDELCLSNAAKLPQACLDKPELDDIMKYRRALPQAVGPYSESNRISYVDRLGASQAVNTLLWRGEKSRPSTKRHPVGSSHDKKAIALYGFRRTQGCSAAGAIPMVFWALRRKRRAAGERAAGSGTEAPSCRWARGASGRKTTPGWASLR